jgi:hypothetical protein
MSARVRRHLATTALLSVALAATSEAAVTGKPTTADCLTASHGALDLGTQHKLRAQRDQLLVCASASCPAAIRKDCVAQVEEIKGEIPTIIFAAKDPSGADVAAVKVTMDGETLATALDGVPLPVDPGSHAFTFEMAGQAPVTKTFVIQEGQHDRRETVLFGAPVMIPVVATAAPDSSSSSGGLGTQRTLAIVAGGLGVVGLGVGTAFGIVALSQKSGAETACPSSSCATEAGSNKWSQAATSGNVSTVALIVGGVGIAGAAVLWLTAPGAQSGTTQVGIGPGVVEVKGTW